MTKRTVISFLIYGLVFAGLISRNGGLLALALPLIVYLMAGLLYQPEALNLTLNRQVSRDQVSPGETVEVSLTISNGGQAIEELLIEDLVPSKLTVTEGDTSVLTTLAPGETVSLTYTVQGERGVYFFSMVRVTVNDRLRLFSKQDVLSAPGQLMIFPEVLTLRRVEIRPRQTRVYSGQIPTQQGGSGIEFFGVREYQPGDPLRWINHQATARYEQALFINEFRQERMADIGLILDARQQSNVVTAEGALFEYLVRATTALATTFLNNNNRVGLFIYGNTLDWTYPGYGKIQRQRILSALARTVPSDSEVFAKLDHLPTRLFPARSQLVFISALLPEDVKNLVYLKARGFQLLVISPDPVAYEARNLAPSEATRLAIRMAQLERNLLLDQLRQAGIQVMDWDAEIPFEQAAHAALSRAQVVS